MFDPIDNNIFIIIIIIQLKVIFFLPLIKTNDSSINQD